MEIVRENLTKACLVSWRGLFWCKMRLSQTIMDRSTAKMSKKLDVPETAGEGETSTKRSWPFLHPGLVAKGSDVYVSCVKDGPKSARGADSFEAGDFVSWRFRINQLAGPICMTDVARRGLG